MKNRLIKFILSFTDYDKLKAENKQLKHDISILIESPDSLDSHIIIQTYINKKQVLNLFWIGEAGAKVKEFIGFPPSSL